MPKSAVYTRAQSGEALSFNMTPMIDVTFQLIIFFILAGQMASEELAQLILHRPYKSQAIPSEQMPKQDHVVINVVSKAGTETKGEEPSPFLAAQVKEYRVGKAKFLPGDQAGLVRELTARKATLKKSEDVYVEIRSDSRVSYAQVEPVMIGAAQAGFRKMNLTALTQPGGE